MTLTDEILLQYADGQLDPATMAVVAAALQHDDVAMERVRLMRLSGAALEAETGRSVSSDERAALAKQFLGGLADPRPAAKVYTAPHAASVGRARRSWSIDALAAGLLLAIGLGLGVALDVRREASAHPVWVMRVVDYHTLYGRSTVSGSSLTAAEVAVMERRFGDAIGKPIKIPAFDAAAMDFRRGQILEFEQAPIIQLAYLPKEGTPMALCLKRGDGGDTSPTYERLHGIGMVRWRRAGIEYVLVGDQGEASLQGYAKGAIDQIAAASRT